MPANEIKKPSLTQRSKITSSTSRSSTPPKETKPIKMKTKDSKGSGKGDEISLGKVLLVVLAVAVVAVIAALLVTQLSGTSEDQQDGDGVDVTPTPTVEVTPTPTVEATPTPTVEPTTTPTPTPTSTGGTNEDNDWGQTAQSVTTGATSVKMRTYQWEHAGTYFELNFPSEALSGTADAPNATASYNSQDKLEVEVSNVGAFYSCTYMNDHSTDFAKYNINSVTCSQSGTTFTFIIDVASKVDFRLLVDTREIPGTGEFDALIIQVKR
jgi:hypothetical protein